MNLFELQIQLAALPARTEAINTQIREVSDEIGRLVGPDPDGSRQRAIHKLEDKQRILVGDLREIDRETESITERIRIAERERDSVRLAVTNLEELTKSNGELDRQVQLAKLIFERELARIDSERTEANAALDRHRATLRRYAEPEKAKTT